MNFISKPERSAIVYLIVIWMVLNILLFLALLPSDYMDLNNWIELGLWIGSIAGLLSLRKWGVSFALFTMIYTLSTSVSIIIYYQIWLNAARVIINAAVIIYLFNTLFKNKYK